MEQPQENTAPNAELLTQRNNALVEIIESERRYVKFLEILDKVFVQPLMDKRQKLIPSDCVSEMFPDALKDLLIFNTSFLSVLEARFNCFLIQAELFHVSIADLFVTHKDFFSVYISFISDYKPCLHAIRTYKERFPKLKEWLDGKKYDPATDGQDLASLLVMIVQRIPRYVLLLKALEKYTDTAHVDAQNISQAIQFLQQLVDKQEAKLRECTSTRKGLVYEGLLEKEGGKVKSWKARTFRLFHTHVEYTKPNSDVVLGRITFTPDVQILEASERAIQFCFKVTTKDRCYYMKATSKYLMNTWVKKFQDVLSLKKQPDDDRPKSVKVEKLQLPQLDSNVELEQNINDEQLQSANNRRLRSKIVFKQNEIKEITITSPRDNKVTKVTVVENYFEDTPPPEDSSSSNSAPALYDTVTKIMEEPLNYALDDDEEEGLLGNSTLFVRSSARLKNGDLQSPASSRKGLKFPRLDIFNTILFPGETSSPTSPKSKPSPANSNQKANSPNKTKIPEEVELARYSLQEINQQLVTAQLYIMQNISNCDKFVVVTKRLEGNDKDTVEQACFSEIEDIQLGGGSNDVLTITCSSKKWSFRANEASQQATLKECATLLDQLLRQEAMSKHLLHTQEVITLQ